MKPKEKLKVLEEIDKTEQEASKYSLGGNLAHMFIQDSDDPKMFWFGSKKISEAEVEKYSKYSNVIRVIYASNDPKIKMSKTTNAIKDNGRGGLSVN